MIILLLAAWVLGGLLLALGVGAAVRVAEARGDRRPETLLVEPEVLTTV